MIQKEKKVIIIVGPTASGKTHISLRLARQVKGEIVSADSRQIYKYMNIGTAKPSPEELQTVPHHCIDIKEPDEFFNAGRYGKLSRFIVSDILKRNKLPIVVGGSGLYIRALVDGIFEGEYRNTSIREKLKKELTQKGAHELYARLCQIDPLSAEKIHPHDTKRLIRALEVYELSGVPISKIQERFTKKGDFTPLFFGLYWPRKILYQRLEERVDAMMEVGFMAEVENLLSRGYSPELNSLDSLGYREIISFLKGKLAYSKMVEEIKKNTRRFAKRQLTWFRKESRIQWIDLSTYVDVQEVVDEIVKFSFRKDKWNSVSESV